MTEEKFYHDRIVACDKMIAMALQDIEKGRWGTTISHVDFSVQPDPHERLLTARDEKLKCLDYLSKTAKPASKRKSRYVSVNGLSIRTNNRIIREGTDEPLKQVIRVQDGKSGKAEYGDEFEFFDAEGNVVGRIFYETDRVLKCGAKCVIEFYHEIKKVR